MQNTSVAPFSSVFSVVASLPGEHEWKEMWSGTVAHNGFGFEVMDSEPVKSEWAKAVALTSAVYLAKNGTPICSNS
jgi:hypothetical protein